MSEKDYLCISSSELKMQSLFIEVMMNPKDFFFSTSVQLFNTLINFYKRDISTRCSFFTRDYLYLREVSGINNTYNFRIEII